MFGSTAQPNHVARLENSSVIFNQFALENEELLVTVVPVGPGRHAGRHAVDVKSDTNGKIVIKLEYRIAKRNAIGINEWFEIGAVDIGNSTIPRLYRMHLALFPVM